ncbi:MAG: histidine phosphatase family protein [Clostridia bacterium]|nr:histidine phosphatase family protein [Clostridia bacterium]
MKIYFVRHGHPNYREDCLTPLGHKQAAAAAERLRDCGIGQIFASTKGRAMETAGYTARMLGLDIVPCDFMREIHWGSLDGEPFPAGGHPWDLADLLAAEGTVFAHPDWAERDPFCRSQMVACCETVAAGVDAWLGTLGYIREGAYYRAGENTDRTVAMFSHAGSGSAALAHLFNLPFPQVCASFSFDFTSVTLVSLPDEPGRLVAPKFQLVNDAAHIARLSTENIIGN